MTVSAINTNSYSNTSSAAETAATASSNTLNQDSFLKLLMTQMTTQNPLNPTSDTEFISQLAQFNSLQTATEMQADVSKLRTEQQFTTANALLGRGVELKDGQTGFVSAVQVEDGTPRVIVNDQAYDLDQVSYVVQATQS